MLQVLFIGYILICVFLYFFQEKLIFFPEKLARDYSFHFKQPFEEIDIPTADGDSLNGLLFTVDQSKGLIFYLHGNAGSLAGWGEIAGTYTALGYSVFFLDYRGFGKSQGKIKSRSQFLGDVQRAYDLKKKRFDENATIILGYSIGSGPAAYLASENNPRKLILQAPYYSVSNMMRKRFPIIPTFLLKYNFQTFAYLKNCAMPVVIFHGDSDEVIDYHSSKKLEAEFKDRDTLITLKGQGHNGMSDNPHYQAALKILLQ